MNVNGRYIAAQIDTRTGCHQILNTGSLPLPKAIDLFHAHLPQYAEKAHGHLHRILFKTHEDCSGMDKTEGVK